MSYLRGPLTRLQIKQLMAPRKAGAPAAQSPLAGATIGARAAGGVSSTPPVLPPGLKAEYLPVAIDEFAAMRAITQRVGEPLGSPKRRLVYEPAALGMASIRFLDRKLGIDENRDYSLLVLSGERPALMSWRDSVKLDIGPRELEDRPASGALFVADLPEPISNAKSLAKLEGDLADELYRGQFLSLAYNPTLKLYARSGESERDFRSRCQQVAREARDAEVDKIRDRYEAKIKRLEDRLANQEQDLAANKDKARGRVVEEGLSGLATVAGFLGVFGSKSRSLRSLSTAATKRRMTSSADSDIKETEADIARSEADLARLKSDLEGECADVSKQYDENAGDIQSSKINAKKADVDVQVVTLAWAPTWEVEYADARGRNRTERVPAYALVPDPQGN
jgi:hypothetical protein